VRELIVKFAIAHRIDQNVDDYGDLVERWNGDCVLALLDSIGFDPDRTKKT